MKILKDDNTIQIIPSGHQQDEDVTWNLYDYNRPVANMSDDFPINYTEIGTGINLINIFVEVQTINSEVVGIVGANAWVAQIFICDGTIHDSSDLISNGTFESWESDGTPTDWDVGTDANLTEVSESIPIEFGGYTYNQAVRLDQPDSGADIYLSQTITVDASTYYKLSIINKHYAYRYNRYSIYDESNEQDITPGGIISGGYIETFDPADSYEAVTSYNEVFETPSGCTSITINIYVPDTTDYYIEIYGVSLRPIVESFDQKTIRYDRLYDGISFNTYVQEYTKIVGEHSVLLHITQNIGGGQNTEIGCLQTGELIEYNDPKETMAQGLIMDSPYVDLKYGGRLIVDKYNLDVFDCTLIFGDVGDQGYLLLETDTEDEAGEADEFMFETFPDIRLSPRFMILGNLDAQDWCIFARFENPPIMEDYGEYKCITFRLIEAI